MRRLLLLAGSVVFFDTLFFAALTPLLPHYVHVLHMGKPGAGLLSATYPLGALVGAIPSGIVAARAGFKPTVLVGLCTVAACTVLFGFGTAAWELDAVRFAQGVASAFSWTGALAWLVAGTPAGRRGALIGNAFAAAVGGALFGPVLGAVASFAGTRPTFAVVGVLSLGLAVFAATTEAPAAEAPQPLGALGRSLGDRRVLGGVWFVLLPALLFGVLGVLAPLHLSRLGFGGAAIGAVFLCSAAFETANNLVIGRASDRVGTYPLLFAGLVCSAVVAAALPLAGRALLLAPLVVCGGLAFGSFFTPGMTQLTHVAETRGLDHSYTFALVNLAWAPGQALGAVGAGVLAHATSDAVPYLALVGVCALTLAALWHSRGSTAWTTPSAQGSSGSSSLTTGAG